MITVDSSTNFDPKNKPFESKFTVLVSLYEVYRIGKNDGIIDFDSMITFEKISDTMARALIEIGAVIPKANYHTWVAGKPSEKMVEDVVNSNAAKFINKNIMTGFRGFVSQTPLADVNDRVLDFLKWLFEKTERGFVKNLNLTKELKSRKINANTIMFLSAGNARVLEKKGNSYRWDYHTPTGNATSPTFFTAEALINATTKYMADKNAKNKRTAPSVAEPTSEISEISKFLETALEKLDAVCDKIKKEIDVKRGELEFLEKKLQQATEAAASGKKLLEFDAMVNALTAPQKMKSHDAARV